MKNLIFENDELSNHYLENIRKYNSALAFDSTQANIIKIQSRGPYCFKRHGQMYHLVTILHPSHGSEPLYAGLFIIDSDEALECRMNHKSNKNCRKDLMADLMKLLENINPYAKLFHHMVNVEMKMKGVLSSDIPTYQLMFTENNAFDKRHTIVQQQVK